MALTEKDKEEIKITDNGDKHVTKWIAIYRDGVEITTTRKITNVIFAEDMDTAEASAVAEIRKVMPPKKPKDLR